MTPPDKDLYLIVDNASTHKHARVRRWLARHPRFHVYFTPTSSSWLNMVERFFRDLTQRRLRRGVFRGVEELIMAIGEYVDQHNEQSKPSSGPRRRRTSWPRWRERVPLRRIGRISAALH